MAESAERLAETAEAPPPSRTDAATAQPAGSLRDRFWSYTKDLVAGVWKKGEQDNIFFLAGAIAFNVLVAFIPLLLAIIGIAGTVLRGERAQQQLIRYLDQIVPAAVGDVLPYSEMLGRLAENSTGILSIGTLFFLWIATRLVGTLRTVLREIFDIPEGRDIIRGKIFDIKMVVMAGTLFIVNWFLTGGLALGASAAERITGIHSDEIPILSQASDLWPQLVAFITIWVMFLLIYRYLPPRRIKWRTSMIAATFTALLTEVLKFAFTWYVSDVADFTEFWGNVATFVILVLWIYYTSVVFILGGEVAQVVSMRRIRKRQRERLA